MTIFLPALAVAFAAFCVWLTVRVVNRRERWAKWTPGVIAFVLVVVYPLSIGPGYRVALAIERGRIGRQDQTLPVTVANSVYAPVLWLATKTNTIRPLGAYIKWWVQ